MAQYDLQWKRYRRLCIWFVAIFCSFVPVTIGGAVISQKLFHTDAPFPYVAGFLMLLWAVSFFRICAFACPRCGKCFIGEWWYGNWYFITRCRHCGLPRDPKAI